MNEGTPNPDNSVENMHAEIARLEAECQTMRRERIWNSIEDLVQTGRITLNSAERWFELCLKDETTLKLLQNLPENLPGGEPVGPDFNPYRLK